MLAAVIFLFHPSLGGQVQVLEGQLLTALEHGHQTSFESSPEGLLLGVLVRRIGQGRLVQYAQVGQACCGLLGSHGRTVIGHQGARAGRAS